MGEMLQPRRFGSRSVTAEEFLAAVAALTATVAVGPHPDGRLTAGRLSGRWSGVTGADVADWLLLAAADQLVLAPRSGVEVVPVGAPGGSGAGRPDVVVSELPVADERVFETHDDAAVVSGAAAAAAVAGAADGLWRAHVAQVRERLAASYGSAEVADLTVSTRQVARAASDIDAAMLQIVASLTEGPLAARMQLQAAARACDAADRVLGGSRGHALDASDPVARLWRGVHTGYRLTVALLDARDS